MEQPTHHGTDASHAWSPEDEQTLIGQLQAGNTEAFNRVFKHYHRRVCGQALSLLGNEAEAEEITQEVFAKLYEKGHTFRGDAAVSTWLYRVTSNAALSQLRCRKSRQEVCISNTMWQSYDTGDMAIRPVSEQPDSIEHDVAKAEELQFLAQAIDALQPAYKAVVLSELNGLSNQETGERLQLSIAAVKARRHRARLFLREKLLAVLEPSPV